MVKLIFNVKDGKLSPKVGKVRKTEYKIQKIKGFC